MNPLSFPSRSSLRPLIVAAAVMFAAGFTGNGQTPFKAGDILTTNLTMQNRFRWTNDNGQVFPATNSSIRLSDFAGKIAFFVFFDVW